MLRLRNDRDDGDRDGVAGAGSEDRNDEKGEAADVAG
jgi:hypothetical protein